MSKLLLGLACFTAILLSFSLPVIAADQTSNPQNLSTQKNNPPKDNTTMQSQTSAIAQKNLAESKKFLEENKKKSGVVTLPSGLQYKIEKEGTGNPPGPSDFVTVHYRGTLINGTEFDSSHTHGEPATFAVNAVIPGWTEALQLMKPGAKWTLYIPPNLAYGDRSIGRLIGPNSALVFEVQLLSIKPASDENIENGDWEDID